jgi:hypothetical protein
MPRGVVGDSHASWREALARVASCLLLSLIWSLAAQAQDQAADEPATVLERAGITGSIRAGYWSSTRALDRDDHIGAGMLWIKATRPLAQGVSFLVEGWTALRGPTTRSDATAELREAFVDVRLGQLDVRLGRQVIAWGRADGVNPTDNLTGEDLTLLAPDDDDRRLGATAVRASYYFDDVSVTGLWVPEFRPHRFPLPPPPPGLTFVSSARQWPGDVWAVRVEQTGRAVDWSASYVRGLDTLPDLGPDHREDGTESTVRLAHHPVRIFGADMAANAGRFGLRAEGAYVATDDSGGRDRFTKNAFIFLVVGGDRTFREHLNLNVQYLYRFVFDYRPLRPDLPGLETAVATQQAVLSGQTTRVQHGASFRIAYKWLRETLEAECAAAGYVEPRGFTIRPKLAYAISDHWKLIAGAELFNGESSSVFGLLRPNSTAFVEARWSF